MNTKREKGEKDDCLILDTLLYVNAPTFKKTAVYRKESSNKQLQIVK